MPQPNWARAATPNLNFLFYRSPTPFDHVLPVQCLVTPMEPEMSGDGQESRLRATNNSVIKLNHGLCVHPVWERQPVERRGAFLRYLYGRMHSPQTVGMFSPADAGQD